MLFRPSCLLLSCLASHVVVLCCLASRSAADQECGKRFFTQNLPVRTWIVGGVKAVAGAYPYQASLQTHSWFFGDSHICGATVISRRWIVTAAHCLEGSSSASSFRIVLGEDSLSSTSGREQKKLPSRIVTHPRYDSYTTKNDVALIKLSDPIRFGDYVQPACLPDPGNLQADYKPGRPTFISGWGEMDAKSESAIFPGRSPSTLRAAIAPLLPQTYCASSLIYGADFDPASMICAGYSEGGVDSCQGDSGGPLVAEIEGRLTLLGITSWGEGCAQPNLPGVYTFVGKYVDWIRETIAHYGS